MKKYAKWEVLFLMILSSFVTGAIIEYGYRSGTTEVSAAIEEPNDIETVDIQWADIAVYEPCTTVVIGEGDAEITLEWETGVMVVTGANEEGARVFFEHILKPIVDDYIANKLKGKQ